MTRTTKTIPLDLCLLHVKPKRSTDPSMESRKFSSVIAQTQFDEIRDFAMDVFTSVGFAKSDCPEVWYDNDRGIKLLWCEEDRFLHVKILKDKTVFYYVATSKQETPIWMKVSNSANVEEVLFKLGRYITGSKETDCGEHR